ncbi:hypothetical protein JAAARDRAFT_59180 [Jaapia argillacea MUCL 33604]|uniref:Uncharacterized protein n=1 Tax=Jaapia argillacea MUCL 33604 TaxID=933084 RepID=A0A067PNA0_9AGAM|nr:hypothetical protein JAAARDRAFT_59180 [Jaapia argillacea MUCL 33604]
MPPKTPSTSSGVARNSGPVPVISHSASNISQPSKFSTRSPRAPTPATPNPQSGIFGDTFAWASEVPIKSIRFRNLTSSPTAKHRRCDLEEDLDTLAFAIDPSQDLLVLATIEQPTNVAHALVLHCRSFSQDKHGDVKKTHPDAQSAEIKVQTHRKLTDGEMRHLRVQLCVQKGSISAELKVGEGQADKLELMVVAWRRSTKANPIFSSQRNLTGPLRQYSSFTFLDEDRILLASSLDRCLRTYDIRKGGTITVFNLPAFELSAYRPRLLRYQIHNGNIGGTGQANRRFIFVELSVANGRDPSEGPKDFALVLPVSAFAVGQAKGTVWNSWGAECCAILPLEGCRVAAFGSRLIRLGAGRNSGLQGQATIFDFEHIDDGFIKSSQPFTVEHGASISTFEKEEGDPELFDGRISKQAVECTIRHTRTKLTINGIPLADGIHLSTKYLIYREMNDSDSKSKCIRFHYIPQVIPGGPTGPAPAGPSNILLPPSTPSHDSSIEEVIPTHARDDAPLAQPGPRWAMGPHGPTTSHVTSQPFDLQPAPAQNSTKRSVTLPPNTIEGHPMPVFPIDSKYPAPSPTQTSPHQTRGTNNIPHRKASLQSPKSPLLPLFKITIHLSKT